MRKGILVGVVLSGVWLWKRNKKSDADSFSEKVEELRDLQRRRDIKVVEEESMKVVDKEFLIRAFPDADESNVESVFIQFVHLINVAKVKDRGEIARSFRNLVIGYKDLRLSSDMESKRRASAFIEESGEHFLDALKKSSKRVKTNGSVLLDQFFTLSKQRPVVRRVNA